MMFDRDNLTFNGKVVVLVMSTTRYRGFLPLEDFFDSFLGFGTVYGQLR